MSNKKQTSVQEAIDLIKQDYEANGRLRLAFVLQTLNNAEGKHKQEIIDAHAEGVHQGIMSEHLPIIDAEQYYKENYTTREAENCKE